MLDIKIPIGSQDYDLFVDIINQGIDSRLEGFTKSKFYRKENQSCFDFHDSEISILLRRLSEKQNNIYNPHNQDGFYFVSNWENDIVLSYYGFEIY